MGISNTKTAATLRREAAVLAALRERKEELDWLIAFLEEMVQCPTQQ